MSIMESGKMIKYMAKVIFPHSTSKCKFEKGNDLTCVYLSFIQLKSPKIVCIPKVVFFKLI